MPFQNRGTRYRASGGRSQSMYASRFVVHEHFLPERDTNNYHRESMKYTKAVFELSGL